MNLSAPSHRSRQRIQGNTRLTVLLVIAILIVGAIALWFARTGTKNAPTSEVESSVHLAEGTKAVLDRLTAPVDVRFYSILDPATTPAPLVAYAVQISRLLADFERAGKGRVNVAIFTSISNSVAEQASADGIRPFNLEKGAVCYFALAVTSGDRTETVTELDPEWAPAIEFDLGRAIQRVSRAKAQPAPAAEITRAQTEAAEQIKRLIPDLDSVTLEEGTQKLRDAAMKDFKAALDEMGPRVTDARLKLQAAEQGGNAAEQEAARANLQKAQTEQAEKVKEIAARLDQELEALRGLKAK